MREFPKVVKGGIVDYKVVLDDGSKKLLAPKQAGFIDPIKKRIVLGTDQPKEFIWRTFFHEMIHKWEIEASVSLRESEVDRLATVMYEDFRRNGWVLPGCTTKERRRK